MHITSYKGNLEVIDEYFSSIEGKKVVLVVDNDGSIIPFMECYIYSGYSCGGTPVELKVSVEKLWAIPFSLVEGIMKPFPPQEGERNELQ